MEEFGASVSIDGGSSIATGVGRGPGSKQPLTRKEKIQEELKLLEWHKLANDAAIKASLMQNRQLKHEIPNAQPAHTEDDAKWMKKVIQQEHIKPLEVNKDYVLEYEKREKENEERLTTQVERHIGTLQRLRGKLEAKAEMKGRIDEYRSWQRDFTAKKNAVMIGQTLGEIEAAEQEKLRSSEGQRPIKRAPAREQKPSELSGVLDSLNKLADLEGRITSLEKDNVYERMVQSERPSADRRTVLDFKKSRATVGPEGKDGTGPVAVVYSMRPKQKSWQVPIPGVNAPKRGAKAPMRGAPAQALRGRKKPGQPYAEDQGTFLTGMDDDGEAPANPRLARARQINSMKPGQKALRGRVQIKKGRAKEENLGNSRHEKALGELNRRRNEQQIQKRPNRPGKGAAGGVKTNNKHLNDFEKTKRMHKTRKDNLSKKTAPAKRTMNRSMGSKTAPSGLGVSGVGRRGMPNTNAGAGRTGNMTRRTNEPSRRGMGGPGGNSTAPTGAVGGIGGIRALRNKRGGESLMK